jgi:hypothetical protein
LQLENFLPGAAFEFFPFGAKFTAARPKNAAVSSPPPGGLPAEADFATVGRLKDCHIKRAGSCPRF